MGIPRPAGRALGADAGAGTADEVTPASASSREPSSNGPVSAAWTRIAESATRAESAERDIGAQAYDSIMQARAAYLMTGPSPWP